MTTTEQHGAVTVLTPEGPLVEASREAVLDAVREAAAGATPMLVLNLANSPVVDSVGLETLLDARDLVRGSGGVLQLSATTQLVADVLHATGVGDYFDKFDDVRTAVGSFAR